MRKIEYLNGIAGVAPGGLSTLNIQTNRRYHGLKVFPTGKVSGVDSTDPVALIESVKIIVGSTVVRDLTPQDILDIAATNAGGTAPTDHLPIHFSDPSRATIIGEEATSWDLFGYKSFTLQIKWKKTDITVPDVRILATYDHARNLDAKGKPFANIVFQVSRTINAPAGPHDITNLPINAPIFRLHFAPSSGTVDDIEVKRDGELVLEGTKAELDAFYKDYGIQTPFALSAVFDYEQQLTSPLVVRESLNVRPTFSAENSARVIIESVKAGF